MRYGKLQDSFMGPAINCRGEEQINKAWEADTPARQTSLARKGLEADADNIDGYNILGIHAKTQAERIALFREGVRVGERLFAPLADDPEMPWWGFMGTRPYMRAIHNLGIALEAAGDLDEAAECYQRLIDMNPNDNQGVRGDLTRLLMARGKVGDLRKLLKAYPGDGFIEGVMAHFWLGLRSKNADMARLAAGVEECNQHILPMMVGKGPKTFERSPYGITMGGPDEAENYLKSFGGIWAKNKKAMEMIAAYVAQKKG